MRCPICGAGGCACGARPTRFIPVGLVGSGQPNPEYTETEAMAIVTTPRGGSREGEYTSNERLYLDADGKVVKADDPNRVSLLVAEGGVLDAATAKQYNLGQPAPAPAPAAAEEPKPKAAKSEK